MSFTEVLHQGITKYDRTPTIKTVEICDGWIECPKCEIVLEAGSPGKYLCPFCDEIFIVV
jgi:hypothetical protein